MNTKTDVIVISVPKHGLIGSIVTNGEIIPTENPEAARHRALSRGYVLQAALEKTKRIDYVYTREEK